MAEHPIRKALTWVGTATAHPAAFVIVLIYAVLWVLLDRESLNWHGAATLATWLMTLFIQRAEHRDTQAIQAKLDELLKANHEARDEITRVDDKEPEEIEEFREEQRGGSTGSP
jgi:low affinity Fe/Cu permease